MDDASEAAAATAAEAAATAVALTDDHTSDTNKPTGNSSSSPVAKSGADVAETEERTETRSSDADFGVDSATEYGSGSETEEVLESQIDSRAGMNDTERVDGDGSDHGGGGLGRS